MPNDSSQPFETLAPGTELGRYRIERVLGIGGMGAVYQATHRDLKKRVAIKTLHPEVAAMPTARARFLREGEAASRINHPNVVDVTDVGTERDITFLVMELLEGEDLAAMLERGGALPIATAVDIMLCVAGAITIAHEEGVIHRDLKPANVFLARARHGAPRPVVLDFGISKLSAGNDGALALTGTGAYMGTPYYIAPEQIRSAAGVDGRSDQYALGAILYECVTGQRAHQGETIYEVIRSVGEGAFRPPRAIRPDIPRALEDVILRAMRLDPGQRFVSVQAFGRALLPFASVGAREQWAPALGGDVPLTPAAIAPATMPMLHTGAPALTPSRPGASAGAGAQDRLRAGPRAITTFSESAAQIGGPPVRRRRDRLVAGGAVIAAAGLALVFWAMSSRGKPIADDRRTPDEARQGAAAAPAPPRDRPMVDHVTPAPPTPSPPEAPTKPAEPAAKPPDTTARLPDTAAKLPGAVPPNVADARPSRRTAVFKRDRKRNKMGDAPSAVPAVQNRGANNAAIIE